MNQLYVNNFFFLKSSFLGGSLLPPLNERLEGPAKEDPSSDPERLTRNPQGREGAGRGGKNSKGLKNKAVGPFKTQRSSLYPGVPG